MKRFWKLLEKVQLCSRVRPRNDQFHVLTSVGERRFRIPQKNKLETNKRQIYKRALLGKHDSRYDGLRDKPGNVADRTGDVHN